MSTPEGFFNSMASKGVSNGHYLMNFTYSQTGGVPNTVYPCTSVFTKKNDQGQTIDDSGFIIYKDQGKALMLKNNFLTPLGWCSCTNCAYNCSTINFDQYLHPTKVTDGKLLHFPTT